MGRLPEYCVFCHRKIVKRPKRGERKKTSEHVPPRGFFPKILPKEIQGLVTVPACEDCNHRKGDSDDFLREALLYLAEPASEMAKDLYNGPHLSSLSKDRRKYNEWYERVIGTIVDPITGESRPFLKVEAAPLRESLSNIARGVLWHREKRLVPPDCGEKDGNGNEIQFFQANLVQPHVAEFFIPVFPFQPVSYLGHPEIFEYRFWQFACDPNWMAWHFKFFGGANVFITSREIVEQLYGPSELLKDSRVKELNIELQKLITPSLIKKLRFFRDLQGP